MIDRHNRSDNLTGIRCAGVNIFQPNRIGRGDFSAQLMQIDTLRYMRAHRGDAVQALYAIAAAQERYRMVHGRYADRAGPAPPVGLGLAGSERGWYRLRIERADASGFIASARPIDGTPPASDEACRLFTIDALGTRGSVPAAPDTCWP